MMGSQTSDPLSLFGRTRQTLLALLYSRADEEHLQESLIQLAGLGRGTVQRELDFLARAGVVRRTRRGRQVYFQANAQSPIYAELRGLVVKTSGVADVLRGALAQLSARISVAFVYGSVAKGSERRGSFAEVSEVLGEAQKTIGREVNPSVYTVRDFGAKVKAKNHFLRTVLRAEKIFLIGDGDELARLAKK